MEQERHQLNEQMKELKKQIRENDIKYKSTLAQLNKELKELQTTHQDTKASFANGSVATLTQQLLNLQIGIKKAGFQTYPDKQNNFRIVIGTWATTTEMGAKLSKLKKVCNEMEEKKDVTVPKQFLDRTMKENEKKQRNKREEMNKLKDEHDKSLENLVELLLEIHEKLKNL